MVMVFKTIRYCFLFEHEQKIFLNHQNMEQTNTKTVEADATEKGNKWKYAH